MELSDHYRTISEQMKVNFEKNTFFFIRDLIICGLLVDIHFTYHILSPNETIQIELFNDNLLDENGGCVSLLHFEIFQQLNKHPLDVFCKLALENLLEYIKDVKFDVLIGRYVPVNSKNNHLRSAPLQFATRNLFASIGIEMRDNSNDCVICYERTYCKTVCNHYLCFSCCSNIRPSSPNDSEEDDEENVHCPICRGVVLYSHTGGCGSH